MLCVVCTPILPVSRLVMVPLSDVLRLSVPVSVPLLLIVPVSDFARFTVPVSVPELLPLPLFVMLSCVLLANSFLSYPVTRFVLVSLPLPLYCSEFARLRVSLSDPARFRVSFSEFARFRVSLLVPVKARVSRTSASLFQIGLYL